MRAKCLILLTSISCHQIEQSGSGLGKSRLCAIAVAIAHKVIHKICGYGQNRFSISNLGALSQMIPSFATQLVLPVG
jgi:hypothetical protein